MIIYYPKLDRAQPINGWVSQEKTVVNIEPGQEVVLSELVARQFKKTYPFMVTRSEDEPVPVQVEEVPTPVSESLEVTENIKEEVEVPAKEKKESFPTDMKKLRKLAKDKAIEVKLTWSRDKIIQAIKEANNG